MLTVVLVAVAACGDSGSVETVVVRDFDAEACQVVDTEQVAEIYGVEAVEVDDVEFDLGAPICTVTAGEHQPLVGWGLVGGYDEARAAPGLGPAGEPIEVDGIGDRAFVTVGTPHDNLLDITVTFEVDGVVILVVGDPGAEPDDPARELLAVARSVAERARFALPSG